jgi:hypothetical protein
MRRTVTAICLLFAFTLVDGVFAQGVFQRQWEFSHAQDNRPDFVSVDGEDYVARGIAYGRVNDGTGTMVERLFVVTNYTGTFQVLALDPESGERLGTLSTEGVGDIGRRLNQIGVTDDGIIVSCNEVNNIWAAQGPEPFRCYRWNTLTANPIRFIDQVPADGSNDGLPDWLGHNFRIVGSMAENTATLWTAAARGQAGVSRNVYRFTTTDQGATFTYALVQSAETAQQQASVEGVAPVGTGAAAFFHTIANISPRLYSATGEVLLTIPTDAISPFTVSMTYVNTGEREFLVAFNWEGGGLGQRADVAELFDGRTDADFFGQTPSMGTVANFQANGDVAVRVNQDGTMTLFVLAANNGIGAFKTTERVVSTGPDELPSGISLRVSGVHPNPFVDHVNLSYEVEGAVHMQAAVYDVLGRHVATLYDGMALPGRHDLMFEPSSELASGTYLIRLTAGGETRTARVVLRR